MHFIKKRNGVDAALIYVLGNVVQDIKETISEPLNMQLAMHGYSVG